MSPDAKRLAEDNTHLAKHFALEWMRKHPHLRHVARDDIEQEAAFGLITAAEKFDPARGCTFKTLAWWWMRHYVSVFMKRLNGIATESLSTFPTDVREKQHEALTLGPETIELAAEASLAEERLAERLAGHYKPEQIAFFTAFLRGEKTLQQEADRVGVSRQRMGQITKKMSALTIGEA